MTNVVDVVSETEYRQWLANRKISSPDLGQEEFEGVCAKCHGFAGQGDIGPKLAGTAVDARALATTIRHGVGLMPAVAAGWNDRQVSAVIDYIKRKVAAGAH